MKHLLLVTLFTLIGTTPAIAAMKKNGSMDKKYHVYGALNLGKRFEAIGEGDANAVSLAIVNYERPGFGVGIDYPLDQKFIMDEINWTVGFYYELKRESYQVSSFGSSDAGGSASGTRDASIDLQAKIINLTGNYTLKQADLLFGVNYTFMTTDGSKELKKFEVKNDYGFHAGLAKQFGSYNYQVIYRYLTHKTKDEDGYDGSIDLSSVLVTVGSYF